MVTVKIFTWWLWHFQICGLQFGQRCPSSPASFRSSIIDHLDFDRVALDQSLFYWRPQEEGILFVIAIAIVIVIVNVIAIVIAGLPQIICSSYWVKRNLFVFALFEWDCFTVSTSWKHLFKIDMRRVVFTSYDNVLRCDFGEWVHVCRIKIRNCYFYEISHWSFLYNSS